MSNEPKLPTEEKLAKLPRRAIVAYAATNQMDPGIYIPAALVGGGLAFASHGTKASARIGPATDNANRH